jgi:hypothetical protein
MEHLLMRKITIFNLLACALLIAGCGHWFGIRGNGHVIAEPRTVTDFSEIYADGSFDIEWRSGAPAVTVNTDDNLMRYIETHVSDNKLRLRSRERLWPTHGVKVLISSPTRAGVKLTGASDAKVPQLAGTSFAVETTGAADVTLDGTIDLLIADMTGASDLKGKSLQTKTAEISTTGAADAIVNVSETLKVTITGAGDVTYYGNPKTIEKHVTGAGSIRHKD